MSKIPFKAVVTDMDGTFLNSQKEYNHAYFQKILKQLKENNIHFIAASGRPLVRLRKDFEPYLDQIDLIADNGSILVRDNQIINSHYFSYYSSIYLINFIQENFPNVSMIVKGVNHTYIRTDAPVELKKDVVYYYLDTVIRLKNLNEIPVSERVEMISLTGEVDAKEIEQRFNKKAPFKIHVSASGYQFADVLPYKINKAHAVKYFLRYFNLTPNQLIAFGDGMNDAEMLNLANYSYAMANADEKLKQIAKYEAPSNDDNGVLKTLEKYLNQ